MGDHLRGAIWDLLSRVGYDHLCLSFVYSCALLLVVLLALCIIFVGGAAFVYMCASLLYWVRLCFRFVC